MVQHGLKVRSAEPTVVKLGIDTAGAYVDAVTEVAFSLDGPGVVGSVSQVGDIHFALFTFGVDIFPADQTRVKCSVWARVKTAGGENLPERLFNLVLDKE